MYVHAGTLLQISHLKTCKISFIIVWSNYSSVQTSMDREISDEFDENRYHPCLNHVTRVTACLSRDQYCLNKDSWLLCSGIVLAIGNQATYAHQYAAIDFTKTLDTTVASGAANSLLFCHMASMLQQIIQYVSLALFTLNGRLPVRSIVGQHRCQHFVF